MKIIPFFLVLVAIASAEKVAETIAESLPVPLPVPLPLPIAILRNVQIYPDALGAHNSDFEAANGITFQFSGSQGVGGGANMIGSWSYPQEDGSLATVNFVANENGFQPESSLLPVAPAFPHPIPQFVLDQIEFARLQKERQAREDSITSHPRFSSLPSSFQAL